MRERDTVEDWAVGFVAAILLCPAGIAVTDTASCVAAGLREPMPLPFDVSGTFNGSGRAFTNTPIGPFLLGRNCVETTHLFVEDGDPTTNNWFDVRGTWNGPLPSDGSFVRVVSPTGRVEDVEITVANTGEIFVSK